MQSALYAQKGLSEEGYKHWIKAVALMENMKEASDYFLVIDEFGKVLETDPTYADAYYNKGVLYTKMGELGGGIPMFDSAKTYYDKYLVLRPLEKNAMLKELVSLETKRESFMRNILDNMSLIEGSAPRKISGVNLFKNCVYVDSFYIKRNLFSVADYKNLITPMAIAVASLIKGKTFDIPYQQSYTGNDNTLYILSAITAEQIIEVLNCVSCKNFFILTGNHYEMMTYSKYVPYLKNDGKGKLTLSDNYMARKDKTLYSDSEDSKAVELFFTDKNKYKVGSGGNILWTLKTHAALEFGVLKNVGFRLAFPASEK
jgi:tetratricopeptide (TPR) repeat protein